MCCMYLGRVSKESQTKDGQESKVSSRKQKKHKVSEHQGLVDKPKLIQSLVQDARDSKLNLPPFFSL
jgi:hypothetical protein